VIKNRVVRKVSSGQSFIEFAIVLPLLLLLGLGVFEFGRAIHAKNIITNMSREGANLASRTSTAPQDIMDALAATAQPLKMSKTDSNKSFGMMYITKVSGKSDGNIEVVTQYKWIHPGSYQPPSRVANLTTCNPPWVNGVCTPSLRPLADLNVLHLNVCDLGGSSCSPPTDVKTAYAVEVFYNYQVIFRRIINYSPQIYSITIF
jgi:hypothetical protein